jgi:anti-sigma factor (TIGR02949 family)
VTADQSVHDHADDLACNQVVELVADYLDGALPEPDARRLEHHLATCPGCAEYLQQLRTIAGSLRGVTDESFPPEMRDGLIADFRDVRKRS